MQAKVQQLQQLHQSLAEQVPQMRADAKQQQDAIRTICSKQARYKQQQQRLLEELRESYFDPSVSAGTQPFLQNQQLLSLSWPASTQLHAAAQVLPQRSSLSAPGR